jgi:hypothetical protein
MSATSTYAPVSVDRLHALASQTVRRYQSSPILPSSG